MWRGRADGGGPPAAGNINININIQSGSGLLMVWRDGGGWQDTP